MKYFFAVFLLAPTSGLAKPPTKQVNSLTTIFESNFEVASFLKRRLLPLASTKDGLFVVYEQFGKECALNQNLGRYVVQNGDGENEDADFYFCSPKTVFSVSILDLKTDKMMPYSLPRKLCGPYKPSTYKKSNLSQECSGYSNVQILSFLSKYNFQLTGPVKLEKFPLHWQNESFRIDLLCEGTLAESNVVKKHLHTTKPFQKIGPCMEDFEKAYPDYESKYETIRIHIVLRRSDGKVKTLGSGTFGTHQFFTKALGFYRTQNENQIAVLVETSNGGGNATWYSYFGAKLNRGF